MRERTRCGEARLAPKRPEPVLIPVTVALDGEVVSRTKVLVVRVRNRDLLPALGLSPAARIVDVVARVGVMGDETEFHVEADA